MHLSHHSPFISVRRAILLKISDNFHVLEEARKTSRQGRPYRITEVSEGDAYPALTRPLLPRHLHQRCGRTSDQRTRVRRRLIRNSRTTTKSIPATMRIIVTLST